MLIVQHNGIRTFSKLLAKLIVVLRANYKAGLGQYSSSCLFPYIKCTSTSVDFPYFAELFVHFNDRP
jgi:hypothetical protein